MSFNDLTDKKSRPKKKKVTFYTDPELYLKFELKVLEEKRSMKAISEKITELIRAYME